MPAAGHTEIIGDQAPGNQPFYFKFSQKTILNNFAIRKTIIWIHDHPYSISSRICLLDVNG